MKCVCPLPKNLDFMRVCGTVVMNARTSKNPCNRSGYRDFFIFPQNFFLTLSRIVGIRSLRKLLGRIN